MSKTIVATTELPKPTVQHPTVGRIVLFNLKAKDGVVTRPAIVVRVWERTDGEMPLVNLQVFTDETNDGLPGITWSTSAHHADGNEAGTWHWMPYQTAKPAADAALATQVNDTDARVDKLASAVELLGKSHKATTKVVTESLRDFTKSKPTNIHEAIQRMKQEGSPLIGPALRQSAGEKFLDWKPKPATKA